MTAFAVASACVFAFVQIAYKIRDGHTLGFDRRVALAIHSLDGPMLDRVMGALTFVGSPYVVLPVAAFVLAWTVRRHEYRAAIALTLTMAGVEVLLVLLKDIFERPRPALFEKMVSHSWSFPSGHAMADTAIYGVIAIVLSRLVPTRARVFKLGFPVLILLIGLSRIYLGVHWPTDVLAGFAAGGFFVVAGAVVLDH